MASNLKITAVNKEFLDGTKGFQVLVDGLDGKLACKMNFKEPLKAIRYMFMLSKRLDLKIDTIQLTALSIAYQRAKDNMNAVVEESKKALDTNEQKEEKPEPLEVPEPEKEESVSPMLKQFQELKGKHPDALLLFRCGDFYETYEDDAESAASILGITLTKNRDHVRMAGFPYHALDAYLPKLIRAGRRVAICDEIEAKPQASKRRGRKAKNTELAQELPLEKEA